MTEKITQVSPRPSVEIHLPDGRVLSGPRESKVGEFLKILESEAQKLMKMMQKTGGKGLGRLFG